MKKPCVFTLPSLPFLKTPVALNAPVVLAVFISMTALAPMTAVAAPGYTGPDYSGIYDCSGKDDHEGDYKGVVTISLVKSQSAERYGAYNFKLEVPGYGSYLGEAAAYKDTMAIHFALTDPTPKDFGTGIATFTKKPSGKWTFKKYYYEPEFKGGNYGMEECTQR